MRGSKTIVHVLGSPVPSFSLLVSMVTMRLRPALTPVTLHVHTLNPGPPTLLGGSAPSLGAEQAR